jgi:hypothetical protein
VRVDLWSTGDRIEPGTRLVSVVSWEATNSDGKPYGGTVTLHGGEEPTASHVQLPVVNGTLGGEPADVTCPARPFAPGYPR